MTCYVEYLFTSESFLIESLGIVEYSKKGMYVKKKKSKICGVLKLVRPGQRDFGAGLGAQDRISCSPSIKK